MNICITGATGFLGQAVVAEAILRGHSVAAIGRKPLALTDANLRFVKADLRSRAGLADVLAGSDLVVHLAAAKSGDLYAQMGGTVVATENLLAAMQQAGVRRIVSISSFAVYEYLHKRSWSSLTEDSPLDEKMIDRDEYAQTKLIQERLVRDADVDWTILRPGMIYGPGNLFNARVGMAGGRSWVRTGAWARIPLTYVENCAEAIVLTAETRGTVGQILNVVDDDPPTQRRYASLLRRRTTPRPRIIPLSWTVLRATARLAWIVNHWLLGGRAKVPGLLLPARLHARCKPLKFPNDRIKKFIPWSPRYGLAEAVDRSVAATSAAPPQPRHDVETAGSSEV
jgi:nucleoside-diphosphate-sugar epimerase